MPYVRKTKRRKSVSRRLKIIVVACLALAAALVAGAAYVKHQETVNARAEEARQFNENAPAATAPAEDIITFAAVGDSITEGNSIDFTGRRVGDISWVPYAESAGVRFVGGWANAGATTGNMAENFAPVEADVLAVLAGTNDIGQSVPFDETTANLSRIVEASSAGRVIISAVPPQDNRPGVPEAFNAELQVFVTSQGWEWIDAAAALRDGEHFAEGYASDGVHPTKSGAKLIGAAFGEAIANP